MLDHLHYLREEIGSYRNLVFKKSDENMMDRKKDQRRSVTSGRSGTLAYKNDQKTTTEICWPYKQKKGQEKLVPCRKIEGKM